MQKVHRILGNAGLAYARSLVRDLSLQRLTPMQASKAGLAYRRNDLNGLQRGLSGTVEAANQSPRRGGPIGEALFFGIPIAVTFSLGTWQLYRLDRKRKLIATREERFAQEPLGEADLAKLEADQRVLPDHRRAQLSGRFVRDREMLVGPRSAPDDVSSQALQWGGTSGFKVVTPFLTKAGRIVLVIRGWVPQRLASREEQQRASVSPISHASRMAKDDSSQIEDAFEGDIELEGILRSPVEERNRFTPANTPDVGDWYYLDAAQMAEALRGASAEGDNMSSALAAAPWVVELSRPVPKSGWPHPRQEIEYVTFKTPPSTHIMYSFTWYSLAIALSLLTRQRFRLRAKRDIRADPHASGAS